MCAEARRRARDLGISIGFFPPGPLNAITDVKGVRVGHCTLVEGSGPLVAGRGPTRTGVTAVVVDQCEQGGVLHRVFAGGFVLAGAGEATGLMQALEWGLIENPIMLTNTMSVGLVRDAVMSYMAERHPSLGLTRDPRIPIVVECDDSYLNDMKGRHVRPEHVFAALDSARSGPVPEGNVGGGTGMTSFDFKAGIGTASRRLPQESGGYTLGALVMANFGERRRLQVLGVPVGLEITDLLTTDHVEGSCAVVVATDAPMLSHQLAQLARRAALGLGRMGSYGSFGSGEVVIAFSTATAIPASIDCWSIEVEALIGSRKRLNPLFEAAIEAVEESVLNSLLMAETMVGRDGNVAYALPVDRLLEVLRKYGRI
ncbi:MAG: P1 family peptidase [Acetobacteraceae bacterium]|nr:P1 family peptidase [Acetobacteraceae bacterium]